MWGPQRLTTLWAFRAWCRDSFTLLYFYYVSRVYSICESVIKEYGALSEMRNRSTRGKPARITVLPPEVPHDLTWDRNDAAAVGSRLVTPVLLYPYVYMYQDRLCGLVVRVPGFDSRRYQIFWEVAVLEQGPLSLVRIIEELFQRNIGSGLENRKITAVGIRRADHETPPMC
jgi:hypothetical protein